MQRKEIDRDEYEAIRAELADVVEIIGSVTTIEGRHEAHGHTILIRQAGRFFVDTEDARHIGTKEEPAQPGRAKRVISPAETRGLEIGLGMRRARGVHGKDVQQLLP